MKALLFSGGLDSTALAWRERPQHLVFIDYGQAPAAGEERACRSIAEDLGLSLTIHRADLTAFGAGPLAGRAPVADQAPEFWPYRNQMIATLAAMAIHGSNVSTLMLGTVATDAVHPDGRPIFIAALDALLRAQGGPGVVAPAIALTTEALLAQSGVPLRVLGWTFSCHVGPWACGQCRGCLKHQAALDAGFRQL